MKLPNRNQILIAIGLFAVEGPDVAAVANWLAASGIPHLEGVVHILGSISLALGGLALAWPRIRSILAAGGLATPPGAVAPWDPKRDLPPNSGVVVPTGMMRGQPNDTTAVFPVDSTEAKTPTIKRDATKGSASAIVLFVLACAFFFGYAALFVSHKAHADALVLNLSDTWTFSPVAALTGEQLNLKTQTFQQGVSLGAGYGCRFTGWKLPLSIEAVGGFAANSNAPNAIQGNLIFVAADNYGIGPGVQVFKDPVSGDYVGQALVSFFLTASWAATTEQLHQTKVQAVQADRAAQAEKGAGK